ncbi:hypothetical protein FPV67DRAFT_655681 [Lyophyllum atratum]|nr:hypothetical protein FPV67DRAFT_655681 [Lyophyllum atratum]
MALQNLTPVKKKLTGAKPPFLRPEAEFLDEENVELIYYWAHVDEPSGPFHISILALKDWEMKWRDITEKFLFTARAPTAPTKKPLPPHIGAAATLCKLGGERFVLLFGGQDAAGSMTSDLYAINLDKYRWWKVNVPDDVIPRSYAQMVFVHNSLFIFGGKDQNSFTIAKFDPLNNSWSWPIDDRLVAYPSHVPSLGYGGDALPIFDNQGILLLPGFRKARHCDVLTNFIPRRFVLFDTTTRTFELCSSMGGEFPSSMAGYSTSIICSGHFFGASRTVEVEEIPAKGGSCSILLAAEFDVADGVRDLPTFWVMNFSTTQPSTCYRLDSRAMKASGDDDDDDDDDSKVLTDRRILLFGSDARLHHEDRINICVEIDIEV